VGSVGNLLVVVLVVDPGSSVFRDNKNFLLHI